MQNPNRQDAEKRNAPSQANQGLGDKKASTQKSNDMNDPSERQERPTPARDQQAGERSDTRTNKVNPGAV